MMQTYPENFRYFKRSLYPLTLLLLFVSTPFYVSSCKADSDTKSSEGLTPAEKLTIKHRCFSCHQKQTVSVGPSYLKIAAKYSTSDKPQLIESVSKGSAGKWSPVMMPPHPGLALGQIDSMVTWILTSPK